MTTKTNRDRWIAKGMREPTAGILDQAVYSMGLAEKHRPQLLAAGFTEEKLAQMATRNQECFSLVSARHETKVVSQAATTNEGAAVTVAKAHVFKLRQVLPMVLRDAGVTDITSDQVAPSGTLGRSTARILKYLATSKNMVARYEEQLRPYFNNESPVAVHERVTNALSAAERDQEVKRQSQPKETLDLHEAKGVLLELIEDLNRIGRVAFMGQAEIAGQFNKDILLRARGRGGKASTTTTTDTPTPGNPVAPE